MTIKKPGLGMNIVPSEMQLSEQWKLVQGYKSAKGIAPRRYASVQRALYPMPHAAWLAGMLFVCTYPAQTSSIRAVQHMCTRMRTTCFQVYCDLLMRLAGHGVISQCVSAENAHRDPTIHKIRPLFSVGIHRSLGCSDGFNIPLIVGRRVGRDMRVLKVTLYCGTI